MSDPCTTLEPKLSAYADGELVGEEALELRRHVAACATCGATVTRYDDLRDRLRRVRIPRLDEAMVASMIARARDAGPGWGQLAAAALIAALLPAALALCPAPGRSRLPCTCDVVTPALDSEL